MFSVRVPFDEEFDRALIQAETVHMQQKKLKNNSKLATVNNSIYLLKCYIDIHVLD